MRSAPDGYTLLAGNLGTQAASVGLYPNLAYDPRTDFEHIILTASPPMLVPGDSEQTRTYALELVRTEIDKWVPVIRAAGVVVN